MDEKNITYKIKLLPTDLQKEADLYLDYLLFKAGKKVESDEREPGKAKGLIELKEGFDDPLKDFSEYMDGWIFC